MAAARVDSDVEPARIEAGAGGGEDDVARQRQVDAGTDGGRRDGRDRRDGCVGEGQETGVARGERKVPREQGVERAAGAEDRGFSGQHEGAGAGLEGGLDSRRERVAQRG